ncbi:glycosyltransferase [Mucilaginibacter sp.]|uniref:glycosyltransferase n=1 Tax=Mucilaginibacter sp. TaxID=1882438 RepID=UPI002B5C2CFA|nr:glycosyltransferase [Mucilaginibacter sp.]HTI60954.1 glycosyltransferase [Mucilaginibacter sp.]
MNIFLSFFQSEYRHPIPAYDFWQYYLKNGIEEAGVKWAECPGADWALGLVPKDKHGQQKWKDDTWGKTVEWLKKNPADIFLSYLYPQQVDISAVKEIQKMGIPCVNFFCDHIRDFKTLPPEFKVFDLTWVPEYQAVDFYKKAKRPFLNLPMPMWVEPKRRVAGEEKLEQVTFIGSRDIQRVLLFEEVMHLDPKLPLKIYGNSWEQGGTAFREPGSGYTLSKKVKYNLDFIKKHGLAAYYRKVEHRGIQKKLKNNLGPVVNSSPGFEDYNLLTTRSMITLGVNRYPSFNFPSSKPGTYSRLRDIEAPMLGACYLTEYASGIAELYDIGSEIATYRNADEMIGKIRQLEADPALRKKLRTNGQKRALRDHTIPNSINKIRQALNL